MLGLEQHMEIQRRRIDPALTQPGLSESEPQHLYVYQPAIPLRSDFTRTHYVGDEEDLANKDALPAYERHRPEHQPAVQIIDMAGSAIQVQDPPEPSTISPPDYDVAEVTSSGIPHASTAAPVTVGSEMRP
ncbi:hypothetical protein BGZ68_002395 [Mortierella alpina]|nr:hypothetical protein BGZ68_002395 [Mortierella alpina]